MYFFKINFCNEMVRLTIYALQNSASRYGMTGIVPHTANAQTLSSSGNLLSKHRAEAKTLAGEPHPAEQRRPAGTLSAGNLYTSAVVPVAGQTVAVARITNTAAYRSSCQQLSSQVSSSCTQSKNLSSDDKFAGRQREAADNAAAEIRRPHSVDLGGLARRRPEEAVGGQHHWLNVVPCKRIRPRDCDELPDEFRRAGIGACFEGSYKCDPTEFHKIAIYLQMLFDLNFWYFCIYLS
jgi:hypothetical protein